MFRAVNRRPATAKDWVQPHAGVSGICGDPNGTGTDFRRESRLCFVRITTPTLHTFVLVHLRRCIILENDSVLKHAVKNTNTQHSTLFRVTIIQFTSLKSVLLRPLSVLPLYLYPFATSFLHSVGWDSSVGIATRYGLEDLGIESRC